MLEHCGNVMKYAYLELVWWAHGLYFGGWCEHSER